jgi:hypothetical protein
MKNDNSSASSEAKKNENSLLSLEEMKTVSQWFEGILLENDKNSESPNVSQEAINRLGTPSSIRNDDSNSLNGTSVTDVRDLGATYPTPKNPIADTIFEKLQALAVRVGKQKNKITKHNYENGDVTINTEVAEYKISGYNVEIMNHSNKENKKTISADELIEDLDREIDKPQHKMRPDRGIMGAIPQPDSILHNIISGDLFNPKRNTR